VNHFAAVAVEILGVWGGEAKELLGELGWRLAEASQDTRAKSFLSQLVQRGNALSIMGPFPIVSMDLEMSLK